MKNDTITALKFRSSLTGEDYVIFHHVCYEFTEWRSLLQFDSINVATHLSIATQLLYFLDEAFSAHEVNKYQLYHAIEFIFTEYVGIQRDMYKAMAEDGDDADQDYMDVVSCYIIDARRLLADIRLAIIG